MVEVKNMIKRIIAACCLAVSIILMALPYGVAITFWYSGPPDFETVTLYYSYFSEMPPFGSGNFFPIATAMISIGVLMRIIIGFIAVARKKFIEDIFGKPTYISLMVCMIASILSWFVFNTITTVAVIVLILHIVAFLLLLKRKALDAITT